MSSAGDWNQSFTLTFTATAESQEIEIRNANGSPEGNAFAIDEISITPAAISRPQGLRLHGR